MYLQGNINYDLPLNAIAAMQDEGYGNQIHDVLKYFQNLINVGVSIRTIGPNHVDGDLSPG